MQYWLIKSEPNSFSIDHLAKRPKQRDCWDGVRNYQARNFMRAMQVGDRAFFYHSNANPSGIVGSVEIVRLAYPDPTAWDPASHHFDLKSTPAKPLWDMVDIQLIKKFPRIIALDELKQNSQLSAMQVVQKGSRLSVTPVTAAEWKIINTIIQ